MSNATITPTTTTVVRLQPLEWSSSEVLRPNVYGRPSITITSQVTCCLGRNSTTMIADTGLNRKMIYIRRQAQAQSSAAAAAAAVLEYRSEEETLKDQIIINGVALSKYNKDNCNDNDNKDNNFQLQIGDVLSLKSTYGQEYKYKLIELEEDDEGIDIESVISSLSSIGDWADGEDDEQEIEEIEVVEEIEQQEDEDEEEEEEEEEHNDSILSSADNPLHHHPNNVAVVLPPQPQPQPQLATAPAPAPPMEQQQQQQQQQQQHDDDDYDDDEDAETESDVRTIDFHEEGEEEEEENDDNNNNNRSTPAAAEAEAAVSRVTVKQEPTNHDQEEQGATAVNNNNNNNITTTATTTTTTATEELEANALAEEFMCPLCLEILVHPTDVLPCCHSFCHDCIVNHKQQQQQQQHCPTCRVPIVGTKRNRLAHTILNTLLSKKNKNKTTTTPTSSSSSNQMAFVQFSHDDIDMYQQRMDTKEQQKKRKQQEQLLLRDRQSRKRARSEIKSYYDTVAVGTSAADAICID